MSDRVSLFAMLYMTAAGIMLFTKMVDSRFSLRRTAAIACGMAAVMEAVVAAAFYAAGMETLMYLYSLIVHMPCLLLFICISRHRGWRVVFQMLTSIVFCGLIHQIGGVAYYVAGQRFWVLVAAYILTTAAIFWLLVRWLNPLFRQVFVRLQHGWWLMCLMMAAYYGITIYLIPGYVGDSLVSTVLKPAFSLLMVGFYTALLFLFSLVLREEEARHNAQLFSVQLSALKKRMDTVRAAEDAIRMERHDLRHRLQTVAELVRQGETQAALNFIGAADVRLDEEKTVHWCSSPVLDAVLSSYLGQAEKQNIRVVAHIALPEPLPVEEADLAIVFANALENAINACAELPEDRREIYCNVISYPRLMFEIKNPYAGAVRLDEQGLPLPGGKGHGMGTRSIAGFCRKTGASYQFEAKDGCFSLRVVL